MPKEERNRMALLGGLNVNLNNTKDPKTKPFATLSKELKNCCSLRKCLQKMPS